MMGEGFAIKPVDGKICAPVKGTIKSVFPSFHALTLEAEDGLDILIHIGLDTVELNGNGFCSNDSRRSEDVGELLIQVDLDFLAQNKKDDIVIVIFPEMQDRKLPNKIWQNTNQRSSSDF